MTGGQDRRGGESMPSVADLVREALRRGDGADVRFIRHRHLPDHLFADPSEATHRHIWERSGPREDEPGWQTYSGDGIGPWWMEAADLTEDEGYRLHQLRSDVVRQLEVEGLAARDSDRGLLRVRQPS